MATITLKGREIPLEYTSLELKHLQEQVAPFDRLIPAILGRNPDDETDMSRYLSAEHIGTVAKTVRILGNAGLEESGQEADLEEDKILRAIKPMNIQDIINACMSAMAEGMASEIPPKEEEGPVDETLEKMKKKETREG